MSDNIKVVVKVRPLISREIEDKLSYQWRVKNESLYQIDQNGREYGTSYTFDKVYNEGTKTREVYDDVAKPIVEAAIAGFNGTIFAYGQTSSGKTYTMTGTEDSPGIIPLAVLNLFETIKTIPDRDFLVRVSYIEIYNETLKDLLNVEKKNIKIHDTLQGVKVDSSEKVTGSPEEVLEAMKEGEANRQTGATNMNEESSRSHSIFQITIESREHIEGEGEAGCVNVSQLNLVDLAGSERAGQTGATGIRFKEGTHINKSLSVLGLVIKQLSEDPNKFANYRDSKLTRILQNSLGGNAKTSIICAITPASVEETISTLQFANRAKAIKNKPEVNAVATNATMIQSLTKQLSKLQSQLESKKNLEVMLETKKHVEQDNYNLQKQIANLQKLILNGFGQRSSIEIMGASRKRLQPPRRVTISTLHSIDEDPLPAIPKFCTPSLKYNPLAMSTEFLPIQIEKLSSLPEEPNRMITPPPGDRRVNYDAEIIELDSDDDCLETQKENKCSPYHKCYSLSKTPPCVLRKNATQAEKNLKDIVELTEREKIYTPSVVELIEKLEQNNGVVAKLKEEVNALTEQGKEKDAAMDQLRNQIAQTEEVFNTVTTAKTELEALCHEYKTKLTDWEVTYETLKNKAKIREEELLSLIEEQKLKGVTTKIPEVDNIVLLKTIEKELPNFMDISKDISLVNSDSESNNANDDESSVQIQEFITALQAQLTNKNKTITELEDNLFKQKQRIEFLENSSQELQGIIVNFENKLSNLENENSFLKSSSETLNSTIASQKGHLEKANNDIQSFTSLVQELQIKLTQKENLLNAKINDSTLETMVANEEMFIANNENIKNIIYSFKIALDSRNKEISNMKSTAVEKNILITENNALKEEINEKDKQIFTLIEQVDSLGKKLNENIAVINKLMTFDQELTLKLADVQELNDLTQKLNEENTTKIDKLMEENEKLNLIINEKDSEVQQTLIKNIDLNEKIADMSDKISNFKIEINSKEALINSLQNEHKETQKQITIILKAFEKLQDILSVLNDNTLEVPEVKDNFETIINILSESLNSLEVTVLKVIEEKKREVEKTVELEEELSTLRGKHQATLVAVQLELNDVTSNRNEFSTQNEDLSQRLTLLTGELHKIRNELDSKNQDIINLETNLNELKENNECLRSDLVSKENTILYLQEKVSQLLYDFDQNNWKQKFENLKTTFQTSQETFDESLKDKYTQAMKLENSVKLLNIELEEKRKEVLVLTDKLNCAFESKHLLLDEILKRAFKLPLDLDSKINLPRDFKTASDENAIEQIILILDKIEEHIKLIGSENDIQNCNNCQYLLEAKQEIAKATKSDSEFTNEYSLADKKKELLCEIESVENINKKISGGSELIEHLKTELKIKSNEIEDMKIKANEWKDLFTHLECVMKQEKEKLLTENKRLKTLIFVPAVNDNFDTSNSFSDDCCSYDYGVNIARKSPQSLLTICCNRIIEVLEPKENDFKSITTSSSKSSIAYKNAEPQTSFCECTKLSSKLKSAEEEILKLMNLVKDLENTKQLLLTEKEEVCKEVQLLLEPAIELQKKIANHRTNLSTLTATTYAENKLLNSQLKVLKHHHTRYIHVCQRDIPAFKSQLHELMTMLKGGDLLVDKQNASFKRYSLPDVLDSSSTTICNFKNESCLDADVLMLDSNVTLSTSANNTLIGNDQTCLDVTQINFDSEVACQTNDIGKVIDPYLLYSQIETLTNENQKMLEKLEELKDENNKLKDQVENYSLSNSSSTQKIGFQNSPSKINSSLNESLSKTLTTQVSLCKNCQNNSEILATQEKYVEEVRFLTEKLTNIKSQKEDIEEKYNNLALEIPSTDALVRKLNILKMDFINKQEEVAKLTNDLSKKNKEIKDLQEENDTLSTQVMENISEADDLKKELDKLKDINSELTEKFDDLQMLAKESETAVKTIDLITCPKCMIQYEMINALHTKQSPVSHSRLNRSFSDSDTSSRYNKICTLQNELHASKEDCKKITEEVATIKNHLERSNLSMSQCMDLDESMGDGNIFTFTKDFDDRQLSRCSMPNIPEEIPSDLVALDKIDCINFYIDKTGAEKENLNCNFKFIDVMKMLYNKLVTEHGSEVENLLNKLRNFEESRNQFQTEIDSIKLKYSQIAKELQEKDKDIISVTNVLSQIKNNINLINEDMSKILDADKNTTLVRIFKENIFKILDTELKVSSSNIFEALIDGIVSKHQNDLSQVMDRYTQEQEKMENVVKEFNNVNDILKQMKCHLADKEKEYNLLKAQKERIHEISNAVTLDIIKKEQELSETIKKGCDKLFECKVIEPGDIDLSLPLNTNINLIFERIIHKFKNQNNLVQEKDILLFEINQSKLVIEEKEEQIATLRINLQETEDSRFKLEENLQANKSLHEDLKQIYDSIVEENQANLDLIDNMAKEINELKEIVLKKATAIQSLERQIQRQNEENLDNITELKQRLEDLELENTNLKSINQIIAKEKETYALELEKSSVTLKQNKIELDKMTSDIIALRESLKDNVTVIESLKLEAKTLLQQNSQLKEQFGQKCANCTILEKNIKTHEKTAEIQSKMIIRLQKQKEDDTKVIVEKNKQLEELTQKYAELQKEREIIKTEINTSKDELDKFKNIKESLEVRVMELETAVEDGRKQRLSVDGTADNLRRRRQSIHDSKRMFVDEKLDIEDQNKVEAMFSSRSKPDDLFMDTEDEYSNRSTPLRLSKGRDSLPSKPDQSDEETSRPSSVQATRRRRQSIYDQHRSALQHTPSPHDLPTGRLIAKLNNLQSGLKDDSEVTELRGRLASCQKELEDLQEKYRELDDECETCAQYLRERDEQCIRLKCERTALERQVAELTAKLEANQAGSKAESKHSVAHAAVNTDEDWANLHSVVVDRMSFDAEVEKNKKLTRIIEELRYKKQELRNNLAKLEKHVSFKDSRELEITKAELKACKQELEALKERYDELDEECETCAEYLKERDEQVRKLKEAKAALEAKLLDLQQEDGAAAQSARMKRRSLHDRNRGASAHLAETPEDNTNDFVSKQVERDDSSPRIVNKPHAEEITQLRMAFEQLSKEKTALEHQLTSMTPAAQPTMFVSTGSAIVQNQQITDVMKENQQLKKINKKLIHICKKRGKNLQESNRENDDRSEFE